LRTPSWPCKLGAAVLCIVLGWSTVSFASRRTAQTSLAPGGKQLGDRYLLLVNTAFASDMNAEKMLQFGKSAYDGLAVSFSPNYDASPPPSPSEIAAKVAEWQKISGKDIWPWVFLTRMIAVNPAQNNPHTLHEPYFRRIQGMDLDDKAGARSDFLKIWGNSLRAARESGVPGIACDLEFYNDYRQYDPRELARLSGKSPEEAIALLQQLGARMADIAADQYPGATLWFLFTGFAHPGYTGAGGQHYDLSSAYVARGLLDEIESKHFQLRVISGGEIGLGYCHSSLPQFQNQIHDRAAAFGPELRKYAGALVLAGTLTLWSDRSAATGDWVKQGDCAACPARTVEELQPYLELLLRSYRYNWIWASDDAGYDAFDPRIAPRFDAMIAKAKSHVPASPTQ
jgi:hypothetical protein